MKKLRFRNKFKYKYMKKRRKKDEKPNKQLAKIKHFNPKNNVN